VDERERRELRTARDGFWRRQWRCEVLWCMRHVGVSLADTRPTGAVRPAASAPAVPSRNERLPGCMVTCSRKCLIVNCSFRLFFARSPAATPRRGSPGDGVGQRIPRGRPRVPADRVCGRLTWRKIGVGSHKVFKKGSNFSQIFLKLVAWGQRRHSGVYLPQRKRRATEG
jgi:hypothetical protein